MRSEPAPIALNLGAVGRALAEMGVEAVGFLENQEGKPGVLLVARDLVITAEPAILEDDELTVQ
jgi:hypothetical protein